MARFEQREREEKQVTEAMGGSGWTTRKEPSVLTKLMGETIVPEGSGGNFGAGASLRSMMRF